MWLTPRRKEDIPIAMKYCEAGVSLGHFRACLPEHIFAYSLKIWVFHALLQVVV